MKTTNNGWISIHRKIKDNWVWDKPEYLKLWIDFLLRANHSDNKIIHDREVITIKRGDFISSLGKLSEANNIGIQIIKDFILLAHNDGMIVKHPNSKKTHITICNYDSYQDSNFHPNSKKTQKKLGDNPIKTTNNNGNKDNNENNKSIPSMEGKISVENSSVISSESETISVNKQKDVRPRKNKGVNEYTEVVIRTMADSSKLNKDVDLTSDKQIDIASAIADKLMVEMKETETILNYYKAKIDYAFIIKEMIEYILDNTDSKEITSLGYILKTINDSNIIKEYNGELYSSFARVENKKYKTNNNDYTSTLITEDEYDKLFN